MAQYSIESNICLGWSHYESLNVESESMIELSEDEVMVLVDLVREKGSTDVKELGIEESYPELYEKLNDAYYTMARDAEEMHWLWEGYHGGCFEYDTQELMDYCKEYCGFVHEYSEEDFMDEDGNTDDEAVEEDEYDSFNDWLDDYLIGLSDKEARDFFYEHMGADVNLDDIEYKVSIPEAIIKMANEDR